MDDMTTVIWLKKYLMGIRNAQFHEIRYKKTCSLINRWNNNISGHHFTKGIADYENELLVIYEYLERLACQKANRTLTVKELDIAHILNLEELGFEWTGQQFKKIPGSNPRYVKGISLKTKEEVWIPSIFAYYLDNHWDEWNNFAGNSNGNALGRSLDDAIERGINEFMERDKFIRFWYLNDGYLLRIPKQRISGMEEKFRYFTQKKYQLDFFKIENKPKYIHSVWCLIRSTDEKNSLFSFSGFGADVTLMGAIQKAFGEVSTIFFHYNYRANSSKDIEKIISTVSDDIRYFFSYESKEPLKKILRNIKVYSGKDENKRFKESSIDLALDYYKDIVYIPIESDILDELKLYEVKVVGLGGYSMYFHINDEVKGRGKIAGYCPFD